MQNHGWCTGRSRYGPNPDGILNHGAAASGVPDGAPAATDQGVYGTRADRRPSAPPLVGAVLAQILVLDGRFIPCPSTVIGGCGGPLGCEVIVETSTLRVSRRQPSTITLPQRGRTHSPPLCTVEDKQHMASFLEKMRVPSPQEREECPYKVLVVTGQRFCLEQWPSLQP